MLQNCSLLKVSSWVGAGCLILSCISVHGAHFSLHGASAQSQTSAASASGKDDEKPPLGSPAAEMMVRNEIKRAEKLHHENVERAREVAQLSSELHEIYLHKRVLGQSERRKLERIEKLARHIRSYGGGSSGEGIEGEVPLALEPAFVSLAEAAEDLRAGVQKTSRLVVSALVIRRTNQILDLVRFIRANMR